MIKHMLLLTAFVVGLLLAGKLLANSPQPQTRTFSLSPSSPTDAWNPTLEPGQEATLTVNVTSSASHNGYTYNLSGSPSFNFNGIWTGSHSGNSGNFSAIMPEEDYSGNSTVSVSCTWNPELTPLTGMSTNGFPVTLPLPINGGGTATISEQPLDVLIVWSINPADGFRKADGQDKYEFEINALDGEGQPVQVDFTGVTPDNATPATPGWTISGGTGSNTDHVEGEITSTTGSKGNLKIAYTFNGSPDDDISAQELRFVLLNLDIIHPASGLLPENDEISKGGLVAIKRNSNTPVTQLKMHKLSSFPNSEFKLEWSSSKIKIWKDASRTQSVQSGTTTFNTDQDTIVYLEGVSKSSSERDIDVALKAVINGQPTDAQSVKLTVVQAEFPIVVKAFIRYLWTLPEEFSITIPAIPPIPPILAGTYPSTIITGDIVANGDNRTADISDINAPYKLRQMITLTPYTDLHSSSHFEKQFLPTPTSYHYDRILSVPTTYQNDLHGFYLNDPPTVHASGPPRDLSHSFIEIAYHNTYSQVNLKGSGEDGAFAWWVPTTAIPNIDWDIDILVDCANKISPKIKVAGIRDGFPAYEINVLNSENSWQQLYYWFPPVERQVGPSTLTFTSEDIDAEITLQ